MPYLMSKKLSSANVKLRTNWKSNSFGKVVSAPTRLAATWQHICLSDFWRHLISIHTLYDDDDNNDIDDMIMIKNNKFNSFTWYEMLRKKLTCRKCFIIKWAQQVSLSPHDPNKAEITNAIQNSQVARFVVDVKYLLPVGIRRKANK